MTDFKGIRGWKVQTLSTDPAASVAATGTWSAGGTLNNGGGENAGAGTQTASIVMTRYRGASSPFGVTETYDGTSWTEVADVPVSNLYNGMGSGTQTAAFYMGGQTASRVSTVYEWDGSSWTSGTAFNTARTNGGAGGTTTATVLFGGSVPPNTGATELWNGSSWTEVNDMNTARNGHGGAGISTSAIAMGANPAATNTEIWDGTNWTEVSELNTGRGLAGSSGLLGTNNVLFAGGNPGTSKTEAWDGSAWTEVNDLSTTRWWITKNASTTAGFAVGGENPAFSPYEVSSTEEFSFPASPFQKINLGQVYFNSTANAFKVTEQPVPGGSWASGGNTNTARTNVAGAGIVSAAIISAGYNGSAQAIVEQYNGSAWTEVADINTARYSIEGSMSAPYSNTMIFGGKPGTTGATELWNGSAWTETTDMNVARSEFGGAGASTTNGLAFGGESDETPASGPHSAKTETWNGTTWTEVGDLNEPRRAQEGAGTNTLALSIGGNPDPAYTGKTEQWDGSSWTEVGDLNTGRADGGAAGLYDKCIYFGGVAPYSTKVEAWDNSSWTEVADLSGPRAQSGGAGSATNGLSAAGRNPAASPVYLNLTEEWSVAETNKTITVS